MVRFRGKEGGGVQRGVVWGAGTVLHACIIAVKLALVS